MAEIPNADQRDFWSGPSGRSWVENEVEQDSILSAVSGAILKRAGASHGQRILDVGCGAGALTAEAATCVGPTGRVLATDISAPLLQRAAERTASMKQVATFLGDSEVARWPETGFDLAISRFGVMFFAHPDAAFANIARALRSGGRMVFAAWASVNKNPWWDIPKKIATDRLGAVADSQLRSPGPMGLADVEWSLSQFRAAGLSDVGCEEVSVDLHHPGGVRAMAELTTRIGPARRVIVQFDGTSEDSAAIADCVEAALSGYATSDGLRMPATLNVYTATAG